MSDSSPLSSPVAVAPPAPRGGMLRLVERELRVYRRLWRGTAFSTFVIPALFLVAMGNGLGGLIDSGGRAVAGMSYLHFITPGLMAGTAMQSSAPNALWPVMAGTKWIRFFHGIVATPLSAGQVYGGYMIFCAIKATLGAVAFLAVAALLGGVPSAWGLLAVPATVLCALAFTTPLAAYAATQTTDVGFAVIIRLVIVPLFLFSGTFFPVSQLPHWMQTAVWASPLWHAVELCRAFTTGQIDWSRAAVHVAVLVAIIAVGWQAGTRTFTRRLTQ
jgi:lipooligosaccharide transport system permease protein